MYKIELGLCFTTPQNWFLYCLLSGNYSCRCSWGWA